MSSGRANSWCPFSVCRGRTTVKSCGTSTPAASSRQPSGSLKLWRLRARRHWAQDPATVTQAGRSVSALSNLGCGWGGGVERCSSAYLNSRLFFVVFFPSEQVGVMLLKHRQSAGGGHIPVRGWARSAQSLSLHLHSSSFVCWEGLVAMF